MPAPQVKDVADTDESDDAAAASMGFDGVDDDSGDEDFSVGKVDLGLGDDNGLVAGFDGVEDDDEKSSSGGAKKSSGSSGSSGSKDVSIEGAIEDGLSEIACIGLEGSERSRVRREMKAVASQFKVGYFGRRCAEKYLKKDIEDIPPEYGLAAAMVGFFAIALYKRPDGADRVHNAFVAVKDKLTGDPEPEPAEQPPEQNQNQQQNQQSDTDEDTQ